VNQNRATTWGRPYGDIMTFNPDIHHHHSIRLREYDYSTVGAYYVTVCVHGRECLFGDIAGDVMQVNDAGRMVTEWWFKLPERLPRVSLDESVVMPNHFHGIIVINDGKTNTGQPHGGAPTLGDVMGWFKTMTTNAYIHGVKELGWPPFLGRLWQRNYYERVIRNEKEIVASGNISDSIHQNGRRTMNTNRRGGPMWPPAENVAQWCHMNLPSNVKTRATTWGLPLRQNQHLATWGCLQPD